MCVIADCLRSFYTISVQFANSITHAIGFVFFFFQAEDGIRDLVRSRGLGDVYKRQPVHLLYGTHPFLQFDVDALARGWQWGSLSNSKIGFVELWIIGVEQDQNSSISVSYTHLTLPTSDLV